jgi:hypothetical protein
MIGVATHLFTYVMIVSGTAIVSCLDPYFIGLDKTRTFFSTQDQARCATCPIPRRKLCFESLHPHPPSSPVHETLSDTGRKIAEVKRLTGPVRPLAIHIPRLDKEMKGTKTSQA